MFLVACLVSGAPFKLPSVSVPSIPSIPAVNLRTLPALAVPTTNVPAIGLTAMHGLVSTPAPTITAIPVVPLTGGDPASQMLMWTIYGLLALVGIVAIIAMFRRAMRNTEHPGEPPDKPEI